MKPKEIVIISGKGGTGKTTFVGAFGALLRNKVIADCDVDAPDLWILLSPSLKMKRVFKGQKKAKILEDRCTSCGECMKVCRFFAVKLNRNYFIDEIACEGCGFCIEVCPEKAIEEVENIAGEYFVSTTQEGPFVHARLFSAEENTGKLVMFVRNEAKGIAATQNIPLVLIDGPAGTGCPVISSITGTDAVIVIAEPTISGVHDAERIIELAQYFNLKIYGIINKYDISFSKAQEIKGLFKQKNVVYLGRVCFDYEFLHALRKRKNIIEWGKGKGVFQVLNIWERFYLYEVTPREIALEKFFSLSKQPKDKVEIIIAEEFNKEDLKRILLHGIIPVRTKIADQKSKELFLEKRFDNFEFFDAEEERWKKKEEFLHPLE